MLIRHQLLKSLEIGGICGKFPYVPGLPQDFCVPGYNPGVFPFNSVSSKRAEMFFKLSHACWQGNLQTGTFLVPACVGRIQYTPGSYSGRHLNMQRTSLLILIEDEVKVEDESDGARSRKWLQLAFRNGAVGVSSPKTLDPTWWLLVLILTYCKKQNLLPLSRWDSDTELTPVNDCREVPCQQERQRFPHAPSLAPLHTEVVTFSYQKRTDLRLREAWNQGCSQARHIFHPLVLLYGELEGRVRWRKRDATVTVISLKSCWSFSEMQYLWWNESSSISYSFLKLSMERWEMLNQRCWIHIWKFLGTPLFLS